MANTKSKSTNTKKKGSTFSRINFESTKTRIIVTLLVFGVIGGGFTVYKSFAATNGVTFKSSNGWLVCMTNTNCTKVKAPEKGNDYVLKLSSKYNNVGSGAVRGIGTILLPIGTTKGCITAKGYGFIGLRFGDSTTLGDVAVTDTTTYKAYCSTSNLYRVTSSPPGLLKAEYISGTAPVYISSLYTESSL